VAYSPRRRCVEGKNALLEVGEHLLGCGPQQLLRVASGQPLDAVADLGQRDRRRVQLALVAAYPGGHDRRRRRSHEL